MKTTIQKWRNGQGIRIPKELLKSIKWTKNDKINIRVEENKIIIEKVEETERKNIKDLFANYKGTYEPVEINWGDVKGKEIW